MADSKSVLVFSRISSYCYRDCHARKCRSITAVPTPSASSKRSLVHTQGVLYCTVLGYTI